MNFPTVTPAPVANTIAANEARIKELEAQLAAAKKAAKAALPPRELTFKIALKGGISVYGFGQFPVTLYKEQWRRLANVMAKLIAFIDANEKAIDLAVSQARDQAKHG